MVGDWNGFIEHQNIDCLPVVFVNPISSSFLLRYVSPLRATFLMATLDESSVRSVHRRTTNHLLPLSPRLPSSTDRHFEQYLIDHHRYPKLPSIVQPTIARSSIEAKDLLSSDSSNLPRDSERHSNSVNRLLNSEQYRRSHARLIEYRQHSQIPGVALQSSNKDLATAHTRNEVILPLKEVFLETTRTKQQAGNADEIDFVDDDSVFSNDTDRRRRAKHWIKEHQFFFTEYQ